MPAPRRSEQATPGEKTFLAFYVAADRATPYVGLPRRLLDFQHSINLQVGKSLDYSARPPNHDALHHGLGAEAGDDPAIACRKVAGGSAHGIKLLGATAPCHFDAALAKPPVIATQTPVQCNRLKSTAFFHLLRVVSCF